jgi:hypothetical protein
VLATIAASEPAGGAEIGQVIIATAGATLGTLIVVGLAMAHRSGRGKLLGNVAAFSGRVAGLPGWAALPSAISAISLQVALLGMYWDIALHIDDGRDAGPLANPAHYLILFGLFGVFAAGVVGMALPKDEKPGPRPVKLGKDWYAPVGAVLMFAAAAFALIGFPLDDIWHRLFGQDVTLWGPTHLMLIGGAGMTLIGQAILLGEGMSARREKRAARIAAGEEPTKKDTLPLITAVRRVAIMGGLLIGLSTFQAEYDFGVPQYRLVLQPVLIALAAGVSLVAARLWIGRGGAIGAALFFLGLRGLIGWITGPLVFDETFPTVPLYLGSAVAVEVAALALARRNAVVFGAVAGALIGTVGFATEYAWTQFAFRLPWTPDILVEGVLLGTATGIGAGAVGALLALGLKGQLPSRNVARAVPAAAVVTLGVCLLLGLSTTKPEGTQVAVAMQPDGNAVVRFDPDRDADKASWIQVTAWQGETKLHIDHLERQADGSYRTTEPIPMGGNWKSLLRVHDGRELAAVPIDLPADAAIPAKRIPAGDGFTRPLQEEITIMQRERKQDVAGWLWPAAATLVLAIYLAFLIALAWGVGRIGRAQEERGESGDGGAGTSSERTGRFSGSAAPVGA